MEVEQVRLKQTAVCELCWKEKCSIAKCEEIAHYNQSIGELLIISTYTAVGCFVYCHSL